MEKDPMRSAQETVNEQTRRAGAAIDQAQQNASTGIDNMADTASQSDNPTMQRAAAKAKEIADDLRSRDAGDIAQDAKEKASQLASQAADKASQLSSQAADKASEIGTQAADTANSAMTSTGESIQSLAQTVRENAPSGKVGEYAQTTAAALEKSGQYLQQNNIDDVRGDLEALIRRRPVESLLVGLGIGFLLARAFRR